MKKFINWLKESWVKNMLTVDNCLKSFPISQIENKVNAVIAAYINTVNKPPQQMNHINITEERQVSSVRTPKKSRKNNPKITPPTTRRTRNSNLSKVNASTRIPNLPEKPKLPVSSKPIRTRNRNNTSNPPKTPEIVDLSEDEAPQAAPAQLQSEPTFNKRSLKAIEKTISSIYGESTNDAEYVQNLLKILNANNVPYTINPLPISPSRTTPPLISPPVTSQASKITPIQTPTEPNTTNSTSSNSDSKPLSKSWTIHEQQLLLECFEQFNTKWSTISRILDTKSPKMLEAKFYQLLRSKAKMYKDKCELENDLKNRLY